MRAGSSPRLLGEEGNRDEGGESADLRDESSPCGHFLGHLPCGSRPEGAFPGVLDLRCAAEGSEVPLC